MTEKNADPSHYALARKLILSLEYNKDIEYKPDEARFKRFELAAQKREQAKAAMKISQELLNTRFGIDS